MFIEINEKWINIDYIVGIIFDDGAEKASIYLKNSEYNSPDMLVESFKYQPFKLKFQEMNKNV